LPHTCSSRIGRRTSARITEKLGSHWESRRSSFKPFPAAHVIHPYIDAVLALQAQHGIDPRQIQRIDCPVAAYIVGIVCEPTSEKHAPATTAHCRVSLQYTLAEALYRRGLGRDAYQDASRLNPDVLALARRVLYHVDPAYPGPGHFKGGAAMTLADGRRFETVVEHTRGSAENPMSEADLRAKFDDNAADFLPADARDRLAGTIARLEREPDAGVLAGLACAPAGAQAGRR
jgi:2-methylcitrate dehydratase PrpD